MAEIAVIPANSNKKIFKKKLMKLFYIVVLLITVSSCSKDGASGENTLGTGTAGTGKGGSLARFTIAGNYMYAVDDQFLNVFNITDPANTFLANTVRLNFGVETVFPYNDKLFIGARDGMYVYSISDPSAPVLLGQARHLRSCDPVVANATNAFVTLRGNQPCGPAEDGLYIYNTSNALSPLLIKQYSMPTPHGLGLQDSILYVCQKNNGMSVFNVSDPAAPVLRKKITDKVFEDVICYDDLLICYVSTGLALYNISVRANPVFISEVNN